MLALVKKIFGDIFFMYKNFFHWIVSKIGISIASYIMGLLLSLPFFIISLIFLVFSSFEVQKPAEVVEALLLTLYPFSPSFGEFSAGLVGIVLFFVIGILVLLVGISFSRFLLARLNLKYITRKKLEFKKKNYFDFKLLIKYMSVVGVTILYLIIPIGIGVLFLLVSFVTFGGTTGIIDIMENSDGINIFSGMSIIIFLICSLLGIYIAFRTSFAHLVLVEYSEYSGKKCVEKSFELTKGTGKLVKFIGIILMFVVILLPINYFSQLLDFNANNINKYIDIKYNIGEGDPKDILSQREFYTFSILDSKYGGLNEDELVGKSRFLYILQILFFVFNFLVIYGILDMVIASFYKRELLKK